MPRIWEVDFLRGIAILMMVVFHFAFDLNYLNLVQLSLYEGAWLVFQRVTISLFLLLVGVSLSLKYDKLLALRRENISVYFARRGVFLLLVALGISLSTWLVVPEKFIAFGIIHLIALSTIIAIPFLRFYRFNFVLGAALLASSFFISLPQVNTPVLLWFGFTFLGFSSLDYVPLFPWFGLVLIGIAAGKFFYKRGGPIFEKPRLHFVSWLETAGKKSLLLYLIHQPILLGLLELYIRFVK